MAKPHAEVRASGKTAADEAAQAEGKTLDAPLGPDGDPVDGGLEGGAVAHPENRRLSMTPAFSRMRTDWNSPDREVMRQMHRGADELIKQNFGEFLDLMYEIYTLVREPQVDLATGEIVTDTFGLPEWKRVPGTNSYAEDWSRIGYREREMIVYKITTGIFRWSQLRDEMWAEAMFARAQFEEAFAHGYEDLKGDRPTIDDRTARARTLSAEYRYHAVYASYLSRKADSLVRAAELLGQRMKDLGQQ